MIAGQVARVEYLGADAMVECKVGEESLLCRAPGQTRLTSGMAIKLAFNINDLHVFETASGRRDDTMRSEIEMALSSQNAGSVSARQTQTQR